MRMSSNFTLALFAVINFNPVDLHAENILFNSIRISFDTNVIKTDSKGKNINKEERIIDIKPYNVNGKLSYTFDSLTTFSCDIDGRWSNFTFVVDLAQRSTKKYKCDNGSTISMNSAGSYSDNKDNTAFSLKFDAEFEGVDRLISTKKFYESVEFHIEVDLAAKKCHLEYASLSYGEDFYYFDGKKLSSTSRNSSPTNYQCSID